MHARPSLSMAAVRRNPGAKMARAVGASADWEDGRYDDVNRERTFPHSSQLWTRWPLVALLTRPVRVYLIGPPCAEGDEERCMSLPREDPRCGLGLDVLRAAPMPEVEGELGESVVSLIIFEESGDGRRRFPAGLVNSGECWFADDPGAAGV